LEDFKDYLNELSEACEVAALFYRPIADKLVELCWQVKWTYRFLLIFGFILGVGFGCWLGKWIGGF